MATLRIETPKVFEPLLHPARYKGAHGGRGSGKSHFFATLLIERCLLSPVRAVGIREVQKSIKQSVKLLIEDKIRELGLTSAFDILSAEIRGKNGAVITFCGMQDHTADSIKSLEGYDIAWCEEAQSLSERSLRLLRPTIRKENSELWFSWNPEDAEDPVDSLLRGNNRITDAVVVQANYKDNPFLPQVLRDEMEMDKARDPAGFAHTWLGDYRPFVDGAIYGKELSRALDDGRISRVPYDPAYPVITAWDLGFSDATAIWFAQIIGREPRIIDYYEDNLQPLSHYVGVVKERGYKYKCHVLPHDAGTASLRTGTSLATQLDQLGLGTQDRDLIVLPQDAVQSGINLGRNLLSIAWIDADKCANGVKALKKYHNKYDIERKIYKPYHDWSSNGADSFRYLATHLAMQSGKHVPNPYQDSQEKNNYYNNLKDKSQGWMM